VHEDNRQSAEKHEAVYVSLSKLPPFHTAVLRLLNISVESESALSRFEATFESDPALAADLLLVANSAEFGLPSRIATIRHAVIFLGLERVRQLGCTIAFSYYVRDLPRSEHIRAIWSHSVATAVIAETLDPRRDSSVYTTALTHDIGRLALSVGASQSYAELFSGEFDGMAAVMTQEKAQFGLNHCEAGVMVAKKWGLPEGLWTSMGDHHDPIAEGDRSQSNLVRVACQLAHSLGFPEVPGCPVPPLEGIPAWLERPGIPSDAILEKINARIEGVLKQSAGV
jgi:two-component system, cell cycle response regulator